MPALDVDDLAARLRGLSEQQPPQPQDRVPAVRGRAGRIRRRRALAAGVAAVLVAGVPAGVLATRDTAPAPVVPAGTPIGAWPDRSLPDDQAVAQGALKDWREYAEGQLGKAPVRWLFRGDVSSQGGKKTYVAVFLAGAEGRGQQLVTAYADRDQVDDRGRELDGPDPESSPWVTDEVSIYDAGTHVGLYLDGRDVRENTLFVLADPAARALSWTARTLAYAPPAASSGARRSGTASSPDGVFVGDAGRLDGLLDVELAGPSLPVQADQPLSTSDLPALVEAAPLVLPPGQESHTGVSGQSEYEGELYRPDGSVLARGVRDRFVLRNDTSDDPAGGWAVQAVCYGGGSLRLAVMGQRGDLRCDGQQRTPFSVFQAPDPGHYVLRVNGDGLHVYRVTVATVR